MNGNGGFNGVDLSGGTPSAFTSRALTDADQNARFEVSTAQVATVNTGLRADFACTFLGAGALTFDGTADPTAQDYRTTGAANPICSLLKLADGSLAVYGGKA